MDYQDIIMNRFYLTGLFMIPVFAWLFIFILTHSTLSASLGAVAVFLLMIFIPVGISILRDKLQEKLEHTSIPTAYSNDKSFLPSSSYGTSIEKPTSSLDNEQSEFDAMVQRITDEFHPEMVKNEDETKDELIRFLEIRFPHRDIIRKGHDSQGDRIDIVIDGCIAIDLTIVINEGKLIFLLSQLTKMKPDFSDVAVILIDVEEVPVSLIESYRNEFESVGVKTIIKKSIQLKKD